MLGSMQYPLSLAQLVQKAPSALHCGERRIWASPAYAGCISFGSAKARSAHLHLCRTFPPLLVILHNGRAVCPCLIGSGVRDWAPSASCCHPSQPAGRAVCCTQFLLRLLRGNRRLAVPAPCGRTFRWWIFLHGWEISFLWSGFMLVCEDLTGGLAVGEGVASVQRQGRNLKLSTWSGCSTMAVAAVMMITGLSVRAYPPSPGQWF